MKFQIWYTESIFSPQGADFPAVTNTGVFGEKTFETLNAAKVFLLRFFESRLFGALCAAESHKDSCDVRELHINLTNCSALWNSEHVRTMYRIVPVESEEGKEQHGQE